MWMSVVPTTAFLGTLVSNAANGLERCGHGVSHNLDVQGALGCATMKCHVEQSFLVLGVGSKKRCLAMHRGLHCQRVKVVNDSVDGYDVIEGTLGTSAIDICIFFDPWVSVDDFELL